MRLDVENKPPFEEVTPRRVRAAILALRSRGPSSFASLTDHRGNYLLAAGGGSTCMLERRDIEQGRTFRAFVDKPSKRLPDGSILAFGAGQLQLMADEWLTSAQVADAFEAFLLGRSLPGVLHWRDQGDALPHV
jgi:hypothetical protein